MSVLAGASSKSEDSNLHPQYLRCEYLVDPLGIDVISPRLSWYSTSARRDQKQSAYRILVASSLRKLDAGQGDLWDSKKVDSDQSLDVIYKGETLHSGEYCFWKVKVWDSNGDESSWSKPARWSMGLLSKNDWQGYWIGLDGDSGRANQDAEFRKLDPPPNYGYPEWRSIPDSEYTHLSARYLRKQFDAPRKVKRATVYICGLGMFELYFNGKKIGDQVLAPALAQYPKRSFYMTFDVTRDIAKGKNAIGVILGNGRFFAPRHDFPTKTDTYGFPKMIFQLNIEYTDGTEQSVVSDTSWKITADGPIISNNEYDGEVYDARKEMPSWDQARFNDSDWMTAEKVVDPSPKLSAQMINPIEIMQTVKPKSIREIKPGVYVYDMGQNMVGWASLRVCAKIGTKVTMRFAETVNPDGELNTANLRSAKQADVYVANGRGLEEWQPRFVYHGFRFVELTGYPDKPDLNTITGKVVYDDLRTIGHFACSDDVVNRIYDAAYWGIRGNYHSIPTDCPQRDERQGWEGDRSTNSYGESYIFDNNALYSNWMTDIADAQKPSGSLPDLSPDYWPVFTDNMTWPSTLLIIPDHLYRQFGNLSVIADHYTAMKKWLFYMRDKYMKDYLLPKDTYGDWCMPPRNRERIHSQDPGRITPGDFIGSAYFCYCLKLMDNYAQLLGRNEDAAEFTSLAGKVREAINNTYLNKDSLYYANNTVTANAIALSFGIPPKEIREKVFDNIAYKTAHLYDDHTSCGLVGEQWLMRTLTNYGRADLALKIAENTTYPSWGYMIREGATTIWELWNGNTADPGMNSHNHVMLLGDFVVWAYQDLAGIKANPDNPGYKNIVMKPYPVSNLRFVRASYLSPYGLIRSDWHMKGTVFAWDITVPANTTATVYIPAGKESDVTEGGRKASNAEGVKFLRLEDGRAVYEVGSGNYRFVSSDGRLSK
ncbi:MAG: glycoside hydrolase family 78 protein [Bacteroidetes bacterium]|nr:glycoside hydrolase family 78 protein [Bacteroidota bacterium]